MKKNYIPVDVPTKEQSAKIEEIKKLGYKWDKEHSVAAAGVVLKHPTTKDFYYFGLEGEIMHNPEGITIIV